MYMHTTQVHFSRSMSVFAMSNCLYITTNALKTKTKKAVILSFDCPLFSGKRGINAPLHCVGSQHVAVACCRLVLHWYCLVVIANVLFGGQQCRPFSV